MMLYALTLALGASLATDVYAAPSLVKKSFGPHARATAGDFLATNHTLLPRVASSGKTVVAHFMVGNTYSYTQGIWKDNINQAIAAGIDGFTLNVGRDDWQPARVSDAYAAAKGTNFKFFLSFDMSSLPCAAAGDATTLRNYINTYANDANQLWYKNKQVVSTFSGESCTFGQSGLNNAWNYAVKTGVSSSVMFLPSFFLDPATFNSYSVIDGSFNWNGGWPLTDADVDFSTDSNYISHTPGKVYIAPVSPLFFTHYSPQTYNKNWIYRSDDWMYHSRWELLFNNRASIDIVEIISWNDYGESHYIGPIQADQPNSQAWVNGFDHKAFATLTKFYATAWKAGAWPNTVHNKAFLWSRPHPKNAVATSDSVARPTNYQWTDDNLYALVFSMVAGTFKLSIGLSSSSTPIVPGLTKVKLALSPGSPRATLLDSAGNVIFDGSPAGYTYTATPTVYNFNYYVAGVPADGISPIG